MCLVGWFTVIIFDRRDMWLRCGNHQQNEKDWHAGNHYKILSSVYMCVRVPALHL